MLSFENNLWLCFLGYLPLNIVSTTGLGYLLV